jgi:integrase
MASDIAKITAGVIAEILSRNRAAPKPKKRVRFHPYTRVSNTDFPRPLDTTEHSNTYPTTSSIQTTHEDPKVSLTIRRAWAADTLKKYSGGVERYKRFCVARHIEPPFPTTEATLCAFAADTAGSRAGSTIKNDLAGIRAWHIVNDTPFPNGIQLSYVLKGAENMTPATSRKPPRPPMSIAKISSLMKATNMHEPLDAAVIFAASAAFYGQLRLGELFATNEKKPEFKRIPSLSDVFPPNKNGSRRIHLPYTKVAKEKGEEVILCRQYHRTDPIAALENHLRINNLSPSDPLCSFRQSDRSLRTLTKSHFLKKCNEIWIRDGLRHSTGHEFRIGGTTHLLLCKGPPDIVKMMGRWSSDAFQKYWRQIEILAPLYVEFLKPLQNLHTTYNNGAIGPHPTP